MLQFYQSTFQVNNCIKKEYVNERQINFDQANHVRILLISIQVKCFQTFDADLCWLRTIIRRFTINVDEISFPDGIGLFLKFKNIAALFFLPEKNNRTAFEYILIEYSLYLIHWCFNRIINFSLKKDYYKNTEQNGDHLLELNYVYVFIYLLSNYSIIF